MDTTFVAGTPIVKEWLNDVNDTVYGLPSTSSASVGAGLVAEDLSLNYAAGTVGWWDKNAGVSLLRFIPVSKWAAIVTGTNSDDLATYLQAALDAALTGSFDLTGHGYTYKSNSALTWQRSSASHSSRMCFNNATIDFTGMGTTGSALTVGATEVAYFLEQGKIVLRDLTLLGPESTALDPRTDAAGGTTVGLDMQFAGNVTLDNVNAFQFYNNYHSKWVFPLTAINCNFRRAWISIHLDEVSNRQQWHGAICVNSRYPLLIKPVSTSLDDGKTNDITFHGLWVEGSSVGPVIDSGAGGGGNTIIRSISFYDTYVSGISYDHFRLGLQWTLATPATRNANCTEFITDVRIVSGLLNANSGVYSATQALVAMATNQRVRDLVVDTHTENWDIDSDVFSGTPGSGTYISRGEPNVSDGHYSVMFWDVNGSVVRRFNNDGTVFVGAKKTAATVAEVGIELRPDGRIYQTATGTATGDSNRTEAGGGSHWIYRTAGTIVGSISTDATTTTYNTTSDYRRKDNVQTLDGATALASVLSWPIRTFKWKVNGAQDVGVIAHELQAIKPGAVTGKKDAVDENGDIIPQGVDFSKLVPELVAAVQFIADHLGLKK